ncbi:sulfite exporter TauE/SafE family protein [Bacillus sp. HMF5848]|uniref:sulfite exporter TauE/SafE family protein n=1 Tax=Bacillus sp. HMF5848 TaxID=2495421 RepID=UPI000F79D798|nr:sulfite exporter TauE/SafE family protein [Bacillus sp. HMF5848]RSK28451.1 sulfite exporter TauE/SafE family protein [Bacillus sp. HMF5848]
MDIVILIILGLVAGTFGSLVGLGGGVIVVPALLFLSTYTTLLPHVSPQIAVGTSLVVIIFTSLSSTLAYIKHKTVDIKSGLFVFAGSGPGAIVGAWINSWLHVDNFSVYLGIFIIVTSLLLFFNDRMKPMKQNNKRFTIQKTFASPEGQTLVYGFHPISLIAVAFVVGLFSGLFGIGGGSLLVPALILLFFFPPHVAVATSMFSIFLSAIVSSATHISLGHVSWFLALSLAPGAWVGGKLGAWINTRLASRTIVMVLRVILILIGAQLLYEGIF